MQTGNARFLLVPLICLLLFSVASALYNDIGNDSSCFTIYSDKKDYYYSGFSNSEVVTELTFKNNCGIDIPDAQLGVFVPTEYASDFKFKKVELWKNVNHPYSAQEFDHNELNYVTDWDADLNTTGQQKIDYNKTQLFNIGGTDYEVNYYSYTLKGIKCEIPDAFPNRCYYYTPIYTEVWHDNYYYEWVDISKQLAQSTNISNIDIGKFGFTLKRGWKNVTIPKDFHKKLRIHFIPPPHASGEFIIAGRSKAFPGIYYSVLDPNWWNINFLDRFAVNIWGPHPDINTTLPPTFKLENIDSSSWNCDTNNDNIAVVDVAANSEIDAVIEGTCGVGNINILFLNQFGCPANVDCNGSDTNGYYIYVTDTNRTGAKRDQSNVYHYVDALDGFEDGDYTSNPPWTVSSGSPSVQSGVVIKGNYTLELPAATVYTARSGVPDTNDYYAWMRLSGGITSTYYLCLAKTGTGDWLNLGIRISKFRYVAGGSWVEMSGTPAADTDYLLRIHYVDSASTVDFYIYDSGESLITSATGVSITGGGGTPANIVLWIDADTGYFDDITYGQEGLTVDVNITLGSKEALYGPDVNVSYPANNEQFAIGETIDINLSVQHPDSNATELLLDINYSTSQTEGTGTVLVNDGNVATTAGLRCDSNNLATARECKYTWDTTGVSADDYYIIAKVVDPHGESDFNAGADTFTMVAIPDANFIYSTPYNLDIENGITSVSVDFNDTTVVSSPYTAPSAWVWSIDDVNISSDQNMTYSFTTAGDYNICLTPFGDSPVDNNVAYDQNCQSIAIKEAPQGVDFSWSINSYSSSDANVQFTGSSTGEADNYWWFYNDTNYFATTQNASVSFYTYSDMNVCFVVGKDDANKQACKVFDSTVVTVKIPLDESDGTTTITPFNIYVHTIPRQNYDGLSGDTNLFIFSETFANYPVYVDVNADWYGRYYSIASDGTLQILQPYLINTTDGSSIKIVTQSIVDYLPIANVRVKIYKIVGNSERELLEDVTTDSKGEAFTSGIVNDIYEYEVYYQNNLVDNFDITITSTTIYILFNPALVEELEPSTYIDVAFTPAYTALSGTVTDIDLVQTIFYLNTDVNQITIYAKQIDINGNVPDANLYHTTITSGITSGYQNTINIGTDLGGWDMNKTLRLYVKVELSDGTTFTKKHNYYAPTGITGTTWTILTTDIYSMVGCEEGQPCALLILIALFLSVAFTATIITISPFQDSAAIGVVFCFFLAVFALISWVPFFLMAVVSLATLIIAMAGRGAV